MKKERISLGIISLLLLLNLTHAEPTVWYVHPDSALNSIQAALNYCADNDIVLVAPGTYVENILWPNTQGIHLISELGPDTTIIDGNASGTVIKINIHIDSTTIIHGFTVRNGFIELDHGGGINCWFASPTISGNIVTGNSVGHQGGGIYCWNSSAIIINNDIYDNKSISSGAGISCRFSPVTISGNTITDNYTRSVGAGGGIYCQNSMAVITGNTIIRNHAGGGGGGMYLTDTSSAIISNNIISENTANPSYGGAGIYCYRSSPTIDSCTISDNQSDGVYCAIYANPTIHYCNITGNTGFGVKNSFPLDTIDATYNWWGDSTGPGGEGPGTGDKVSTCVDYDPWLREPAGSIEEDEISTIKTNDFGATIVNGPLLLPEGKNCKVFDIMGRVVAPDKIKPGIYFIEIDGQITKKVVKVR